MSRHTIDLFMWGYQRYFCFSVAYLARDVLKELGLDVEPTALLVGARRPGSRDNNPVCVEPEDGQWPVGLFDGLLEAVEQNFLTHRLQKMWFGDEASNLDKPEWMRRDSVTTAVQRALRPYDEEHEIQSFCGESRQVGEFYVVPVIQLPVALFKKFPPLNRRPARDEYSATGHLSLIHAAIDVILDEATTALQLPDPGRSLSGGMRNAGEILKIAAERFMYTPGLSISNRYEANNLFSWINQASYQLLGFPRRVGRLLLVNPENPRLEFLLRFEKPVPINEPRWTRKLLQLASSTAALVADARNVYGLGKIIPSDEYDGQDVFTVDFLEHFSWELRCGDLALLRSLYGVPSLPNEVVEEDAFTGNLERLFPESTAAARQQIWCLFQAAVCQKQGSMLVVAEDAEAEAKRLESQGTNIVPAHLSIELLKQVSSIDGSILLDQHANCHAIGVILDGMANDECTPSRGSRFNSAVRYVRSSEAKRLAIVVSDDRTVDIFPRIRPRQSRNELAAQIAAFQTSTVDNYHGPMNWLSSRRFYLDEQQCAAINATLKRLDEVPREVNELRYVREPFLVSSEFDQSYLTD